MEQFSGEIIVSSQVLWEFRQSARFQVFRHQRDKTKGFSKADAERMIEVITSNVKAGSLTTGKRRLARCPQHCRDPLSHSYYEGRA